jgi:hypothetical protein
MQLQNRLAGTDSAVPAQPRSQGWTWALRLFGLALLAYLLLRLDLRQVAALLRQADPLPVMLALALLVPLIWLKTVRWQIILAAQGIRYGGRPALLAYFGSLFVGFLTPGRLGEFVKAFHVQRECGVSGALAFAGVLADRLFDLLALLVTGGLALLALSSLAASDALGLAAALALLVVPFLLFLNPAVYGWVQRRAQRWGRIGDRLFGVHGWLTEVRHSLRRLSPLALTASLLLTALAYGVYYGQCYLLALALGLPADFLVVTYAVALGSLITLLPISISGLGTREAVMIAYLGAAGVTSEAALGFSLLVFLTFYLGGGLIGLVAWLLKPAPWSQLRRTQAMREP